MTGAESWLPGANPKASSPSYSDRIHHIKFVVKMQNQPTGFNVGKNWYFSNLQWKHSSYQQPNASKSQVGLEHHAYSQIQFNSRFVKCVLMTHRPEVKFVTLDVLTSGAKIAVLSPSTTYAEISKSI